MNRIARAEGGVLQRIVETKRREVAALRPRAPELRRAAESAPPVRSSFEAALRAGPAVRLIAEVKRRSPSAGDIRGSVSVKEQAASYERGGAAAVSVLTDADYFGGSLADLEAVGGAVGLPLLRKDFTIDPVQVWEARVAGAAAVLLIVRILEDGLLGELHGMAQSLGLSVLVETHTPAEVERALRAGARIVGVNNRDLDVFTTDLSVTERLAAEVPGDRVLVGESGIRTRADVERLAEAGVDAVLVGEALMRGEDVAGVVAAFATVPRRGR